jgi:hypothetical protein
MLWTDEVDLWQAKEVHSSEAFIPGSNVHHSPLRGRA